MFVMKILNHYFAAFCIASTFVMVGYWMYKFQLEDRDIGVVDYKSIQESDDVPFPVFSFCFNDILYREKLRTKDLSVDLDQYIAYLEGTFFNDTYAKMNYNDITINFDDFFLHGEAQWANESEYRNDTLTFHHKEIFSGRYFGGLPFSKCFEVSSNIDYHRYVQDVKLYYNLTKLLTALENENVNIIFNVHLLGQFLLAPSGPSLIPLDGDGLGKRQNIWIEEMELLKSRNSHRRTCTPQNNMVSYDDMVAREHIIRKGCTPPYLKPSKNAPPCNTREEIKRAMYIFFEARNKYIPVACDRLSKTRLSFGFIEDLVDDERLLFSITYPEYVKIITQSKEVDFHALIGNIGGYVGLILGEFNSNNISTPLNCKRFLSMIATFYSLTNIKLSFKVILSFSYLV